MGCSFEQQRDSPAIRQSLDRIIGCCGKTFVDGWLPACAAKVKACGSAVVQVSYRAGAGSLEAVEASTAAINYLRSFSARGFTGVVVYENGGSIRYEREEAVMKKLSLAFFFMLSFAIIFAPGVAFAEDSLVAAQSDSQTLYLGAPEGENPILGAVVTINGVKSGTATYTDTSSYMKKSGFLRLDNLVADSIYIMSSYSKSDWFSSFTIAFDGTSVLKSGISSFGHFGEGFLLAGPGTLKITNAEYGILASGPHDTDEPACMTFLGGKVIVKSPSTYGICMENGDIALYEGALSVQQAGKNGIVALSYPLYGDWYGGRIAVGEDFALSCTVKNPKRYSPFSADSVYRYDLKNNPMTVKAKTVTFKSSQVKKKSQSVKASKAFTVKKAKGAVTYAVSKYITAGAKGKIKVSKSGKVTVKKGTAKKTYKLKVKVTAAGNFNYMAKSKTVTLKVKIR